MFGLNTLQMFGAASVAAFLLAGGAYVKGRMDGADIARTETLQITIDQLRERDETDAEVDNLDRYGLCVDLLGRVPECDEFR